MVAQRVESLSDEDRDLVRACLEAAVTGPFFPDWEMNIILVLDRDELAQVLEAWPDATVSMSWEPDPERVQFVAVNNVLNNLIGYPHGQWPELEQRLGAGPDRLVSLLSAWRGDTPGGYVDAIE